MLWYHLVFSCFFGISDIMYRVLDIREAPGCWLLWQVLLIQSIYKAFEICNTWPFQNNYCEKAITLTIYLKSKPLVKFIRVHKSLGVPKRLYVPPFHFVILNFYKTKIIKLSCLKSWKECFILNYSLNYSQKQKLWPVVLTLFHATICSI